MRQQSPNDQRETRRYTLLIALIAPGRSAALGSTDYT